MRRTYNKLVRDRIPEIIESQGGSCQCRVLAKDEYMQALKAKLVEEAQRGGLEFLGTVPEDEEVMEFDIERRSLLELPDESKAVQAVKEIMGKIQ